VLRWVTGQKTRARKTVKDVVLMCRGLQQVVEGQESLFPMFLIPSPVFVCSFHFSLTLDYNFHIRVNLPTVILLLPVPRRWRKPIILHDDGLTQHCTTWGSSAWPSCLLSRSYCCAVFLYRNASPVLHYVTYRQVVEWGHLLFAHIRPTCGPAILTWVIPGFVHDSA
jgi:hypothetical protein